MLSREENIAAVSNVIEAEMTSAWARKASFEVRAFSIVTANLAIVTVFLAVQNALGFTAFTQNGAVRALVVTCLILVSLSLVSAGLSALPRDYPVMEKGGYGDFLKEAADGEAVDLVVEFTEFRIGQLESATLSNEKKAFWTVLAFSLLAAAVMLFAISLVLGSLIKP